MSTFEGVMIDIALGLGGTSEHTHTHIPYVQGASCAGTPNYGPGKDSKHSSRDDRGSNRKPDKVTWDMPQVPKVPHGTVCNV